MLRGSLSDGGRTEDCRLPAFGDEIDRAHSARRFLGGTPGMSALYAARSGYEILLEVGVERIRQCNIALCQRLIDGARSRGLHINTPPVLPSQQPRRKAIDSLTSFC